MEVGGLRHAPAALLAERDPVPIVEETGWTSGQDWTGAENFAPHRDSIPGRPARCDYPVTYSRAASRVR
jgi:hypothetical protein